MCGSCHLTGTLGKAAPLFNINPPDCPDLAMISPNSSPILLVCWQADEMGASFGRKKRGRSMSEDKMPRPTFLRDLADDAVYHAVNLAHGAFDLLCLVALGLVVYASSIDVANAGLGSRPLFGVQANVAATHGAAVNPSHAPSSCSLTNDLLASPHQSCIISLILEPTDI
jgi:hypothetical protein